MGFVSQPNFVWWFRFYQYRILSTRNLKFTIYSTINIYVLRTIALSSIFRQSRNYVFSSYGLIILLQIDMPWLSFYMHTAGLRYFLKKTKNVLITTHYYLSLSLLMTSFQLLIYKICASCVSQRNHKARLVDLWITWLNISYLIDWNTANRKYFYDGLNYLLTNHLFSWLISD